MTRSIQPPTPATPIPRTHLPQRLLPSLLRHAALAASLCAAVLSQSLVVGTASAMDTDIFTAPDVAGAAPNVLIVLDNTSNWSRASQQWPGGTTQGQSEVAAIKEVLSGLPGKINVGMLEFVTGGSAGNTGGFVRFAVSPVGADQGATATTNRSAFSSVLDTIGANINDPAEKRNSGTEYGNLFYDAYNYFAGGAPVDGSSPIPATRDVNGYMSSALTQFRSPLSTSTACGNSYIIFIANPNSSGPRPDTAANTAALNALGVAAGLASGAATTQMALPNFTETSAVTQTPLGYSSACFASAPGGTPTDFSTECTGGAYSSCAYSANTTTVLPSCPAGQLRYSVVANNPTSTTTTTTTTGSPVLSTAPTSSCYASSASWTSADKGGLSCPATTTSTSGGTTTTTSYSCTYSVDSTAISSGSCSSTTTGPTAQASTTATSLTNSCYKNSGNSGLWSSSTGDYGSLSSACPATTTTTSGNVTTTTTYACTFTGVAGASQGGGCGGGDSKWTITKRTTPSVTTTTSTSKFTVTQTATPTITTTTTSGGASSTTLGNTFACYASLGSCSTSDYSCPSGSTCACSATGATTTGSCPSGARYQVVGNSTNTVAAPSTGSTADTNPFNADEWARFLSKQGVPVGSTRQLVRTYAIDVYNKQPSAQHSSLLTSVARAGGGKYFAAQNQEAIKTALQNIFAEIQAVNSTFASASLPISATNRSQNQNQVYIGMFRPDEKARPRWFGNLKRYQLADFNGYVDLADKNGNQAVNLNTGFITPCAASYWSSDSSYWFDSSANLSKTYITESSTAGIAWSIGGDNSKFTKSDCTSYGVGSSGVYSDLPDGPTVEKGGAAQRQRETSPSSRNVKTVSGGVLANVSTSTVTASSNATVNANIVNFILGQDVTGEINGVASSNARPSIHGDVVHSRPLPVTYGSAASDVVLYYGSNDGYYRAVNGDTGSEIWSFVAPESFPTLQRLMDNSPKIQTPSPTPPGGTAVSGTTPKEFFFDGSTGLYQTLNSDKVWIYPSMRRGGRMLYAFNVTNKSSPSLLWKAGCPKQQGDDTGCADGTGANGSELNKMGQTWSTPAPTVLKGYSGGTQPVVVVGGGYDTCEDADSASPSCSSPKGASVFVLDAQTGALIRRFNTDRSVASDISYADINFDGSVDAAYVADTGGNLYRIAFTNLASGFTALSSANWEIKKIASTSGASRKFLFAPAVLPYKNSVYVAIVSGDREHPLSNSYPYTTPVTNRAYVYLDDLSRENANLDDSTQMFDYTSNTTCDSGKVLRGPAGDKYGWYFDLSAGRGEQGVTSALIIGGMVSFSTNRPLPSTGATCSNPLGEARGYWVNLLNGSGAIGATGTNGTCGGNRSAVFPGGGLAPSPVVATVTINGTPRTVVIGSAQKDGSSGSALSGQKSDPPINPRRTRIYWKTTGDTK